MATTLAVSEFPTPPHDSSLTPLSLFVADENESSMSRIISADAYDTTIAPAQTHLDNQMTHDARSVNLDNRSIIERLEALEQSVRARDNKLQACEEKLRDREHRLLECERQIRERDARLTLCEQQLRDREQRLTRCEDQIRARDRRILDCEEQLRDRVVTARVRPRPRPDISDVQLTPMDIEITHDNDSPIGAHTLAQEEVARIRNFSKSKRIFIANLTRKMFSMDERIRDCNVAGIRNRPPLSPTKTRFERICTYTAQQFNCNLDSALQGEVRKAIDDTNRRYREDLKLRKHKREFNGDLHHILRDDFDANEDF